MTCLFVPEDREIVGDKTRALTTKNRIPGSVTPNAFVTASRFVDYEPTKRVFAILLDDSRGTYAPAPPLLEFTRRMVPFLSFPGPYTSLVQNLNFPPCPSCLSPGSCEPSDSFHSFSFHEISR